MGEETKVVTKKSRLPYPKIGTGNTRKMCGYVHVHLSLNLLQDFILIVRGLRISRPQPVRLMPSDRVEVSRLVMQG